MKTLPIYLLFVTSLVSFFNYSLQSELKNVERQEKYENFLNTTITPTSTPTLPPEFAYTEIPFETLIKGNNCLGKICEIEFKEFIQDKGIFERNWKNLNLLEPTNIPQIDFTKDGVLSVYAGKKNTGGHTIEITKVESSKRSYMVTVVETIPGKNCINTQETSSPFHLVKIPSSGKSVSYNSITRTVDCN